MEDVDNVLRNRYSHLFGESPLTNLMDRKSYEVGGDVAGNNGNQGTAAKGGMATGRSHAEGGIKGINKATGQPLEFEGGEVIITKPAVEDTTKHEFEGEMLTNRQILSKINSDGGGVAFADGGEVKEFYYTGKKYSFGGETIEDYQIVNRLQQSYDDRGISPLFKKLLQKIDGKN